jgi:hypothetical protein
MILEAAQPRLAASFTRSRWRRALSGWLRTCPGEDWRTYT